jgi:hypothetical protein
MRSSEVTCRALVVFLVGGIATASVACAPVVRVRPYLPGEGEPVNGAVYHLPQALLQTDFTLKLTLRPAATCAAAAANCAKLELAGMDSAVEQAKLDTIAIPDPAAAFVIQSAGSFMMKTTFAAQFSEKGELTSSKATSADQSLEFATWGLETIAKVAKAIAAAGETPEVTRRHESAKRRAALEAAIAKLDARIITLANGDLALANAAGSSKLPKRASGSAGDTAASVAGVSAEIDRILAFRGKLRNEIAAIDGELIRTLSVPVTCLLDPSSKSAFKISEANGDCPAYEAIRTALVAAEVNVETPLPELTVTLYELGTRPTGPSEVPDSGSHAAPARSTGVKMAEISGFVYRIPAWFRAEVTSERKTRIQKIVAIPQRGQLAVFGVNDGDLRAGKTVEVSLHPSLGMLKEVKLNGEPINLDNAGKLVDSATNVATLKRDTEIARLQNDTALAEAQKNYLEEMAAVEKAKKDLESARGAQ